MGNKLTAEADRTATTSDYVYVIKNDGTADGKETLADIQTLFGSTLVNKVLNNAAGTSYTLDVTIPGSSTDNGKTITFNQAGACTLSIPDGLGAGFFCEVMQLGAGQVTIQGSGGSVTFNDPNNSRTSRTAFSVMELFANAADTYEVYGDTTQNPFKQFRLVTSHDFGVSGSASGVSLDISSVTTRDIILRYSNLKNDTATNIIWIPIAVGVDQKIQGYNAVAAGYGIGLGNGATSVATGASALHCGQWHIEVNSANLHKQLIADSKFIRTAVGYNNEAGHVNNSICNDATITGAIATSNTYAKSIKASAVIDEIRVEVAAGLLTAGTIEIWEAQ